MSSSRASLLLVLVAGCFCLGVRAQTDGWPRYSPCAPTTALNKARSPKLAGDAFVVGLAYWPGGTVFQWGGSGNDTNGTPGLNPCLGDIYINGSVVNYQQYLNDKGVYFSTFSLSTDTMTALRTTKLEEDQLFEQAKQDDGQQVISVIAFRGNIRSEAQYIRSASSVTGGQGVVERLGLIAVMDDGLLTALNWYNFDGCAECGGADSSTCIRTQYDATYQTSTQESCAISLESKECTPCVNTACTSTNCSTTTMVAFRGSTKSGQSLQSAYQLQSAFQYSIYDVLGGLVTDANDLGNVDVGTSGAGVAGGNGNYLAPPAPLPGGEVSDAALAAAQNGTALSPPPATPPPSPPPKPPPSPAAVPVPAPVPVPTPTPVPVVAPPPPATAAAVAPSPPLPTTDPAAVADTPPPPDYTAAYDATAAYDSATTSTAPAPLG